LKLFKYLRSGKQTRRKKATKNKRRFTKRKFLLTAALVGLLLAALYVVYLDFTVRSRFEGRRFALPARVYARPLELYAGLKLKPAELVAELELLGYREAATPREPGSYRWRNQQVELVTRPFTYGDGPQKATSLRVTFAGDRVQVLQGRADNAAIELLRLDPALIGGIYPGNNEDRVLVRLDEVPQLLVDALIAVEDVRFYAHRGIDPRGIARALVMTVSGKSVQGGSTLTQQLVKNFFLSAERTVRRKLNEMTMALLLEVHYSKEEILETYLNEVYLGQDGNRAIHGFGLASSFFFDKPLMQIDLTEAALLVGMLKGPAYYSPRRHPQRALNRRNLVLGEMAEASFITDQQLLAGRITSLGVVERPPRGTSPYPAFLSLIHRQLRRDYRDEDLRSEGLQIFTTLDPWVQRAAENALSKQLQRLEQGRGIVADSLQGALLVTDAQNGEVQAVVGGRDPRFEGFNRALDAQRPIGSLIKPMVFLTALQQPQSYTLATLLDDSPLLLQQPGTEDWQPQNYDKEFHGQVPLHTALTHSYNVSTARLGLQLGVPAVMDNLRRLGVDRELPGYAASLLGADTFSPLEVAQLYQTLASGGFRTPLRAIREVLTFTGQPLQRYPLDVEQVVDASSNYLLTAALQEVVQEGTAKGLHRYLPKELGIAGKTGTTDDFRDSWFAGFSGDRLGVVWVGRDDNQPAGLTGASGAMTVWAEMMAGLDLEPLVLPVPDNIERVWIESPSGLRSASGCPDVIELPFIVGSAPTESAACGPGSVGNSIKSWFERIFQ
jgi:penicillin-binding protein 1B